MKNTAIVLFALSVSSMAFAVTNKIVCKAGGETFSATMANLNTSVLWENCSEQLQSGEGLCFLGKRAEAAKILRALSKDGVMGDEYSLRNVRQTGANSISYVVWDGPNEMESSSASITACK